MDLPQIEAFLVLAEELHFGRASQRLYVSQPMLSRRISSLEREIGAVLFQRTTRRVTLTPLGADLAVGLGSHYHGLLAALEAASDSARGITGTLRVGVIASTNRPSVVRLLDVFQRQHSDCRVEMVEVDWLSPYEMLRCGKIDVLCNWLALDEPDLIGGPMIELCERVLVVGKSHRFAARASISVEEIGDEQINRAPSRFPRALAEACQPTTTPSGRRIQRTQEAIESPAQVAALIARGKIVSLSVKASSFYSRDDLAQIPIADLPPLVLGLIWCKVHENAKIRALVEIGVTLQSPDTDRTETAQLVRDQRRAKDRQLIRGRARS